MGANNMLKSLSAITDVFKCRKLKSLYLKGNNVTFLPHYRHHVISRLKTLEVLDGIKISQKERKNSDSLINQEETWMNLIYANDCELLALLQTLRKTTIHMEFVKKVYGNFQCFRRDIDVNMADLPTNKMIKLIQNPIWNESSYKREVIEAIRTKAHEICIKIHSSKSENECVVEIWNKAFSRINKKQQQCITIATNQFEKLKFEIMNIRKEIKKKLSLRAEPKSHLPQTISSTIISKKLKILQKNVKRKKIKETKKQKKENVIIMNNQRNKHIQELQRKQKEFNELQTLNKNLRKKLNEFHAENVNNVNKAKKK